jgi:hypothetical protein
MPTIINGTTGIDKVQDDSVDIADLSATGTPSASTYLRGDNSWATVAGYTNSDALTLFNASGSAPVYAARAWVNFDGTGTVAIRASGNVSSITDNGAGNYRVNFTNAMPDTNYSACISSGRKTVVWGIPMYVNTDPFLTGSVGFTTNNPSDIAEDNPFVSVAVFR